MFCALLLCGCAAPEEDNKAQLNAPTVKAKAAASENDARGISPEMAKGLAEPGVDPKR